jgi:hypothetical protein
MLPAEPLQIVRKVADVLDSLRIPYLIGGSLASSLHGIPRATLDADLVIDLGLLHVEPLAASLKNDFYLDEDAMREAVRNRSSFNIIHLGTMFKVDMFVLKNDDFSRNEMSRREKAGLEEEIGRDLFVASAEDTLLHKLFWFQAGGGVSERQWRDALGILRVQGEKLDRGYLGRTAIKTGVKDLLERAFHEAEC